LSGKVFKSNVEVAARKKAKKGITPDAKANRGAPNGIEWSTGRFKLVVGIGGADSAKKCQR
jgi:hypothetical protein